MYRILYYPQPQCLAYLTDGLNKKVDSSTDGRLSKGFFWPVTVVHIRQLSLNSLFKLLILVFLQKRMRSAVFCDVRNTDPLRTFEVVHGNAVRLAPAGGFATILVILLR